MPTPAALAIASRGTPGPSSANERTATSSNRSRLRFASARIFCSQGLWCARQRLTLLSGGTSGYCRSVTEVPPFLEPSSPSGDDHAHHHTLRRHLDRR